MSELVFLERHAVLLAGARTAPEVFGALLHGSRALAPRVALFLCKEGSFHGWGSAGYPSEAAERLHTVAGPMACETFHLPDFGQEAADEAVALAVRVAGRTLGVLAAERRSEETPWSPSALGLLVTVAQLRLELDLARRRVQAARAGRSSPALKESPEERLDEEGGPRRDPNGSDRMLATEPPSASVESGLAVVPDEVKAGDPRREEANRFARLVATDIRLYHEEAVQLGRRHGDLLRRLGEQLDRGKDMFERRFSDLGEAGLDLLHDAYVQVLAAGDASLLSNAGPDRALR